MHILISTKYHDQSLNTEQTLDHIRKVRTTSERIHTPLWHNTNRKKIETSPDDWFITLQHAWAHFSRHSETFMPIKRSQNRTSAELLQVSSAESAHCATRIDQIRYLYVCWIIYGLNCIKRICKFTISKVKNVRKARPSEPRSCPFIKSGGHYYVFVLKFILGMI